MAGRGKARQGNNKSILGRHVMVRRGYLYGFLFFAFVTVGLALYNQSQEGLFPETQPKTFIKESIQLERMLSGIGRGIVYCYSNNSKTTGFFVTDHDGEGAWVLTAGHKVDVDFPTSADIFIKFSRYRESDVIKAIKIVPPPEGWDLLLFKVDYKPEHIFKDFKTPHLFEENWIVGFRGNADLIASPSGYVSHNVAKRNMYYTTAPTYFGNSGSPVINRKGEVLGVAVLGYPFGDCYLVPSLVAKAYIVVTLSEEKSAKNAGGNSNGVDDGAESKADKELERYKKILNRKK